MSRTFTSFILFLIFAGAVFAQGEDPKMDKAAKNGKDLPVRINVGGNVTAEAVLIPRVDARRIFGREIANNYAVIEVNVGNKSPDASLVIHDIFIDYSRWALSGTTLGASGGSAEDPARANSDPFEASTHPSHVASEEYRVVRGQLLDAQMWTKRNWTMRLLTYAGNLAGAYAFSLSEQGIVKGLNAFSGVAVPGLREVWPDSTIEQLNRVSDFGFRSNRLVPRQAAEVVVCFFPIDRFLTPGFKKLFLKSPALFFAPGQLFVDKTVRPDVVRVLGEDLGIDREAIGAGSDQEVIDKLRSGLPCYVNIVQSARAASGDASLLRQMRDNTTETCLGQFGLRRKKDADKKPTGDLEAATGDGVDCSKTPSTEQCVDLGRRFATFVALDYLSQASLNSVSVTIDGAMTIDTTIIPAKIDDVAFDSVAGCGDEKQPCFWSSASAGGVRTGTITGSYLTGGTVHIVGANELGITEVNTVTDGSDDQHLHFTFKLTKGVQPGTLTFQVTKPKPGTNTTLDSDQRARSVSYQAVAPSVIKVEQKGNKLTITGKNFLDNAPLPLVVTLTSGGNHVTLDSSKFTIKSAEQIELDIPSEADAVGCWTLRVDTNPSINPAAANNNFVVMPTVDSATLDGDEITIPGTALDARDCDNKLPTFTLLSGTKTFTPTRENTSTATEVKLKLPPAAKGADATWKLQVKFGGKDLDKTPMQLTVKPK
jgi:hypothetical protein